MQQRLAVMLNGRKVGTVHLEPAARGKAVVRMAPLPAFRPVAKLRRTLLERRIRLECEWPEPGPGQVAAEEGAAAVLGALRFTLADDLTGQPFLAQAIVLLKGMPPRLRITW